MIFIAMAALSGLVWGVGDFSGGKAAQRASSLTVTLVSKLASLPVLAVYLVLLHRPAVPAAMGWGVVAGVFGMAGMIVFYRALAGGAMAVVAPVSAVTTALLPFIVGLAQGERPGRLALTGAICAVVAIALVSMAPTGVRGVTVTPRLLLLALGSGVAFGLFFTFTARAGDAADGNAGMWPILAAQSAALVVGAALALRAPRGSLHLPKGAPLRWTVLAGVLDMTANALYLLAVQGGDLSIIAPVAALYPVTTVLLAMLVDRERMRPVQLAGLGLAATALVLVVS